MTVIPSGQQLRYLIALAEFRHFNRAAQACSVTQSTLSAGILAFEKQLGVSLLDRNVRRHVVLTPIGEEVLLKSREALFALEKIQDLVDSLKEPMVGTLRVGMIPTICPFLLEKFKDQLLSKFPRSHLVLNEDLTERLIDKILLGKLDVLVVATPCRCEALDLLPLWNDRFVAVFPKGHWAASYKTISVSDLDREIMISLEDGHCLRNQTMAICAKPGVEHFNNYSDVMLTATSLYTVVDMVAAGFGIALLPQLAIDHGIIRDERVFYRPIEEETAFRTINLAWRPSSQKRKSFMALADAIKGLYENMTIKGSIKPYKEH